MVDLSVGLLEASTGTPATELLRLAPSWVSDQEGTVVLQQEVLHLGLGGLVDVLLVVGDDGLGDGLPHGVHLRDVSSSLDAHAQVQRTSPILAQEHERLESLVPEGVIDDGFQGLSVELDEALAALGVAHRDGGLLASETLNRLRSSR